METNYPHSFRKVKFSNDKTLIYPQCLSLLNDNLEIKKNLPKTEGKASFSPCGVRLVKLGPDALNTGKKITKGRTKTQFTDET